jgi:pimeloyl-ACP methyl ester carboxylesterase
MGDGAALVVKAYDVAVGPWRLRVREAGAGTPIVLVHGLGTSGAYWRHNVDALARCGRVIAVDLPGFGESDTPAVVLSAERLAVVLYLWCQAMNIREAHFIGHSLGGEVCLWLAARYPALVGKLVLAGSTGAPDGPSLPRRLGKLLRDGAREPLAFLPVLMRAYMQAGPWRIWRTAQSSDPDQLAPLLGGIQAETLVLWGANDPVIPLCEARSLARGMPNGRLTIIADGAHGLIFDAPDACNRAVCAFLNPGGVRVEGVTAGAAATCG